MRKPGLYGFELGALEQLVCFILDFNRLASVHDIEEAHVCNDRCSLRKLGVSFDFKLLDWPSRRRWHYQRLEGWNPRHVFQPRRAVSVVTLQLKQYTKRTQPILPLWALGGKNCYQMPLEVAYAKC